MSAKILECQRFLSGTSCTLLFLGSEDDVLQAAVDHAYTAHGVSVSDEIRAEIQKHLELLIVPGSDQAYIGDAAIQTIGDRILIDQPGYALTRFGGATQDPSDESSDAVTVDCKCRDGSGSCSTVVDEAIVRCTGDCVRCAAVVTIPPGPAPPLKMLPAF